MKRIATAGASVVFDPNPSWQWYGWDGKVMLDVSVDTLRIFNHGAATAEDLISLAPKIIGKSYTADGFSDIPGIVLSCLITVDEGTLSDKLIREGMKLSTESTTGKFTLACAPSFKAISPPIPDPSAGAKTGSWRIDDAGQSAVVVS